MTPVKIGNLELKQNRPVFLAPMAGVTDLPFRLLCKEQGCDVMCTEMISAKALLYNNRNTLPLMQIDESEHPIAVQLFGSDPKGLYSLNSELAARVYSAPSLVL